MGSYKAVFLKKNTHKAICTEALFPLQICKKFVKLYFSFITVTTAAVNTGEERQRCKSRPFIKGLQTSDSLSAGLAGLWINYKPMIEHN